jgi:hypothetical protein
MDPNETLVRFCSAVNAWSANRAAAPGQEPARPQGRQGQERRQVPTVHLVTTRSTARRDKHLTP